MLRSHRHLRGFVKLVLWDICCVNGCGSFRLGYVGVGFEGNCDCKYGILYAPMLGEHTRYHTCSHIFLQTLHLHNLTEKIHIHSHNRHPAKLV